jgi:hypothetical protein
LLLFSIFIVLFRFFRQNPQPPLSLMTMNTFLKASLYSLTTRLKMLVANVSLLLLIYFPQVPVCKVIRFNIEYTIHWMECDLPDVSSLYILLSCFTNNSFCRTSASEAWTCLPNICTKNYLNWWTLTGLMHQKDAVPSITLCHDLFGHCLVCSLLFTLISLFNFCSQIMEKRFSPWMKSYNICFAPIYPWSPNKNFHTSTSWIITPSKNLWMMFVALLSPILAGFVVHCRHFFFNQTFLFTEAKFCQNWSVGSK